MSSPIPEHKNSRFWLFRDKFVIVKAILNIIIQATAFARVFFSTWRFKKWKSNWLPQNRVFLTTLLHMHIMQLPVSSEKTGLFTYCLTRTHSWLFQRKYDLLSEQDSFSRRTFWGIHFYLPTNYLNIGIRGSLGLLVTRVLPAHL